MTELLARALGAAGDAIITIDTNGIIRGWNPKCTELFGHPAADALGQSVDIIIPERLQPAHERAFNTAMANGRLSADGHARSTKAIKSDGSTVYVMMTFAVVTDDAGRSLGSVAVARECIRG